MKNKVALLVALVLGLFAMAAVFLTLKKQQDLQKQGLLKIKVAAASQTIPQGSMFKTEHYMWEQIPKAVYDKMRDVLVSEGEIDEFRDKKKTRETIKTGSLIVKNHFMGGTRTQLAPKLRRGHRAVSIGIGYPEGVSGMLRPNSKIDVVASYEFNFGNNFKYQVTFNLLEDLRVLAVDSYTELGRGADSSARKVVEYNSVTLEIPRKDVETLIHTYRFGQLQLAFRKPSDATGEPGRHADSMKMINISKSPLKDHPSLKLKFKKNSDF